MVKIKDVANAAGVSTATVSRVLANKPHVRPEIQNRVLEAVERLNYRPNLVARNLRSNKSNIIALIVSDIENQFFQQISRAVEDTANENGYSVILCNNDEDQEKERRYLHLIRDQNVAGVILSPTYQSSADFSEIYKFDIPMVVIDRRVKNTSVDNILIDNGQAAHRLGTHLLEHGYRRIGAIFGMGSTTGRERREGFAAALKDFDLKPSPDLIKYTHAREEEGFSTTVKLLQLSEPPDAIMTSNCLLAAGAMRALREKKIRIPGEIAFASFDDTIWATLVVPAITVIEQPTYEIGRTATEMLIKRIEDPQRANREVILQAKLKIRESCGCIRPMG